MCGISWISCLPHAKRDGSKSHFVMSIKWITLKYYLPSTAALPESINQLLCSDGQSGFCCLHYSTSIEISGSAKTPGAFILIHSNQQWSLFTPSEILSIRVSESLVENRHDLLIHIFSIHCITPIDKNTIFPNIPHDDMLPKETMALIGLLLYW